MADACGSAAACGGVADHRAEIAMQLNVPRDLELLIEKRIASGAYSSVEEVVRRALEAQDAEEDWTPEERDALSAHIREGFAQSESGELIDPEKARREIQAMKNSWRASRH